MQASLLLIPFSWRKVVGGAGGGKEAFDRLYLYYWGH